MSEKIRNICLLGHGSTGKTSLAESILNLTGMTDRLGKVVEGNSVCDFDAEEIKRQISISTATVYAKYQGTKINILDTPGFFDFAGEVQEALRVADAGIICVSAKDGLNVGAEKSWKYLKEANKPRAIYISKTDEEHADFDRTFNQLREKFGSTVSAFTMPVVENEKVTGIIPSGSVNEAASQDGDTPTLISSITHESITRFLRLCRMPKPAAARETRARAPPRPASQEARTTCNYRSARG